MRIEVENKKIRERKKQEYVELVAEKEKEGMEARIEKISIVTANIVAIAIMIVVGLISFPLFIVVHGSDSLNIDRLFGFPGSSGFLFFFAIYVVSIFVHEFIHGFFWHFPCEKKWGSIDFGFNPKNITPYCHCCEALSIPQYFWGAIAPALILGVIPIVIGIFTGILFFVTFGLIGVVGGAGDLMVIWTLRKHRNCLLFDHPYEVGYAYFVPKTGGDE